MTTSDWRKAFKQLGKKPSKLKKFMKHNAPRNRKTGVALKSCSRCGRFGGHISKYGLKLCRCCFREIATKIGFKKYS
jgi:small subunit ribosomal protein S14